MREFLFQIKTNKKEKEEKKFKTRIFCNAKRQLAWRRVVIKCCNLVIIILYFSTFVYCRFLCCGGQRKQFSKSINDKNRRKRHDIAAMLRGESGYELRMYVVVNNRLYILYYFYFPFALTNA